MKTLFALMAVALVSITVIAADTDNKEAIEKDQSQLQGQWSLQSGSADGYAISDAMLPNFKRVCKADETTVKYGEQLIMKAKFTIEPAKQPKTIDYEVVDGPTKGKTHLGIYEVEGDTMKSCFAAPDMERPADFTTKPGDGRILSVWKRDQQP